MTHKKKKKRIAIISRESDVKTLDVAMLEAELLARGCEVTVLSRLFTKDRSITKTLGYVGHVLRQETAILASDVVVLDTYCIPASMIPHRRGTKVVQIWHALSAIKKFGWQTVGKAGGSSEKVARLMKMHRGYDYVVCASDITAAHFCEAFDTDRSKIVKYGLPRIDYIKSVAAGSRRDDTKHRILSRYPQLRPATDKAVSRPQNINTPGSAASERQRLGAEKASHSTEKISKDARGECLQEEHTKKTILYAPTFRPGRAVDVQPLIEELDPEKYNLVVKLHPLYRGSGTTTAAKNPDASDLNPYAGNGTEAPNQSPGADSQRPKASDHIANDPIKSSVADKSENEDHADLAAGATASMDHQPARSAEGLTVVYDEEFSSFDWLSVADIIISDYSSLVIESTLADKPLFIYAYDMDDYDADTGLNIDFAEEPIAPYVFRDAKSLAAAVDSACGGIPDKNYDMNALRAFRDRYIDIDTGSGDAAENHCTSALADFLERL